MSMLEWNQVSGEFYCDGSWRDIYVLGTGIEHWQRALDALRSSPFRMRYFRAGIECSLPSNAAEAFPEPGWVDRLLSVDLHGPIAHTHFFTETEIEFDLDPGEVGRQSELDTILQFMHMIANATERETILTPENQADIAIFRVRPNDTSVDYTPFGGYG